MPLVVEDGTGLANADSYINLTDAAAYHTSLGHAAWAAVASDTEREALLRRAAVYMTNTYRLRWLGTRLTATQALDWPRAFVPRQDYYVTGSIPPDSVDGQYYYPSDEIPAEIGRAQAELALRAISGDLSPDLGRRTIREKIDVLEFEYDRGAPAYTVFRAVDNMLRPFLSNSSTMRVLRA